MNEFYYDTEDSIDDDSEKLHKVLARAGIGSRREIETWIELGRVQVNGQVAGLGKRVMPADQIKIDNRPIYISSTAPVRRVILYNKPEGEICTRNDPLGRKTVFNHLPRLRGGRWVSVGRLDINTTGLLIFTNDGELANRLMHPSSNIQREYAARVFGQVDEEILERLKQGVNLEDGFARFESIYESGGVGTNYWYHVIINEGRNREVRRLWESQGIKVNRLIRVRFGKIKLPRTLRIGQWLEMSSDDVKKLASELEMNDAMEEREGAEKPRRSNYIRSKKRLVLKIQRRNDNFNQI